jgi:hypothetical protein
MVVALSHEVGVLGVGLVLQEARIRQGASLEEVERSTCIRRANLELLEEERFDELPGDVYAAGFVRSYAGFLGLDADRLVEAFWDARPQEPEPLVADPIAARTTRRGPLLLVAAALVVAAAAAAVLLLRDRGETATPPPAAPVKTPARVTPPPKPLTLRAVGDSSWVVVRHDGPHGKLVWQGTLRQGRMLRFGLRDRLWVGLGKPTAVTARIGSKHVRLDPDRSRYTFG